MINVGIRLQAQILENPEVHLCNHYVLSYKGKLAYGTQTYDPLNPYLRGLNFTIYGWRPNIYDDGWKVETERPK